MNSLAQFCRSPWLCAAVCLLTLSAAGGQTDDRLVGIWSADEGYKTVELLFRSDGHYQVQTTSADPSSELDPILDRGHYEIVGQSLTLISYQYFQEATPDVYQFQIEGDSLSLTGGSDLSFDYQLESGSRTDVLAREQASQDLNRRWTRHLLFVGDEEYTFRPGGYYCLKTTRDDPEFAPECERGRFDRVGAHLTFKPYSAATSESEIDIFGTTLTLISTNDWSGTFTSYEEVPGSLAEVAAKTADAQAFLTDPTWQAGVWQIQDGNNTIDLTIRPDGIYAATNTTPVLRRILRGRYTLADAQLHLIPFVGQEKFTLDDANFGIADQTYAVDYYDGELQLIDLKAFTQSVTLARKQPGTEAAVVDLARQAQAERAREGWYVGVWQAQVPGVWMEFTFRPDNCYIAKSGAIEVERGRYVIGAGKITLAPYPGNGPARGFELDLYDGNLFLIGDSDRMVIVRKIPGSDITVTEKTRDPLALKGERGGILGLWTANRPSESVELAFRPDGQFRLRRCSYNVSATNNTISTDYGLYTVELATRTLVSDSRLAPVQTQHLDFYGDTMTIYGGLTNTLPSTYTANVGTVDAAIAASLAADAAEAQVDTQWLARVPIAPIDPNAPQPPILGLPADPNPGQIFPAPTGFTQYEYYRRLIPSQLAYASMDGTMNYLGVLDVHEWHFFPTGRVLVRFKDHRAGWPFPNTIEDLTDRWGAYEIEPKPAQTDILHYYADNNLRITTDDGEQLAMTLEDGRRNLFWGKEDQILGAWAAEQPLIPCQLSGNPDATLINTGVSLATAIPPDPIEATGPLSITMVRSALGALTISGTSEVPRHLLLEGATDLAYPMHWKPVQSNSFPAGPFTFTISGATNSASFFRIRNQE